MEEEEEEEDSEEEEEGEAEEEDERRTNEEEESGVGMRRRRYSEIKWERTRITVNPKFEEYNEREKRINDNKTEDESERERMRMRVAKEERNGVTSRRKSDERCHRRRLTSWQDLQKSKHASVFLNLSAFG